MARKRRRLGMVPQLRSAARDYVRLGHGSAGVVSLLAEQFPTVALGQIRSIVDEEEYRRDTVRQILTTPLFQFARPEKMAGCGNPKARVRVRIVVHYENVVTGQAERFGHTTELTAGGRAGDILNRALDDVIEEAATRGYEIPNVRSGQRSGPIRYELAYAECIV